MNNFWSFMFGFLLGNSFNSASRYHELMKIEEMKKREMDFIHTNNSPEVQTHNANNFEPNIHQ